MAIAILQSTKDTRTLRYTAHASSCLAKNQSGGVILQMAHTSMRPPLDDTVPRRVARIVTLRPYAVSIPVNARLVRSLS